MAGATPLRQTKITIHYPSNYSIAVKQWECLHVTPHVVPDQYLMVFVRFSAGPEECVPGD